MAASAVDTTAIAAIVIGLGGTVAAMVYPVKYPNAPKWAVNLSWWGGLSLVVAGVLYLITEHFSALSRMAGGALDWLFSHVVAVQRLPGFWLVVAFAAGLAANRWLPSLWKKLLAIRSTDPQVTEWLTPMQAAEKFVDPELFSKDRMAHDRAKQLGEGTQERADADYVAKRRRTDVTECLRELLATGKLVARGNLLRKGKREIVSDDVTYLPGATWRIFIEGVDCLDLDRGIAQGGYPQQVFRDVMIGKNEAASN